MQNSQLKALGHNLVGRLNSLSTDKRLPALAMLGALLLLTQSMASLTWKFVPMPEGMEVATRTPVNRPAPVTSPEQSKKDKPLAPEISAWHLFGQYVVKKPPPPAPVLPREETAKPTRLNLKLKGIFASTNSRNARAIIADAKNAEDSYKVGDPVPGGAIIHKILVDKVILEHNGKLETLLLPEIITGGVSESSSAIQPTPARSSPPAPQPSASLDTANAQPGPLLRDIRDRLVSDPQSVMGLIRAQPYRKNGKLAGYRIRPGKDRQLLQKFGLRSGDVVTSINGVPMDNPLKALELMRDLKSATSLSVDIERRGVPQSLNFSIP